MHLRSNIDDATPAEEMCTAKCSTCAAARRYSRAAATLPMMQRTVNVIVQLINRRTI